MSEFEVVPVEEAGMSLDDYPDPDPEWATEEEKEEAVAGGLIDNEYEGEGLS